MKLRSSGKDPANKYHYNCYRVRAINIHSYEANL